MWYNPDYYIFFAQFWFYVLMKKNKDIIHQWFIFFFGNKSLKEM